MWNKTCYYYREKVSGLTEHPNKEIWNDTGIRGQAKKVKDIVN